MRYLCAVTENTNVPVTPTTSTSPLLVLALSLVGISLAAPLVRLSVAPALVIAAWRLGFSLVVIGAIVTMRREWSAIGLVTRTELAFTTAAGALLALHFWSWNVSLRYTTVAASVALVNLQPVVIAFVSARWLNEHARRAQWIGIWIAVAGALVVGLADVPGGLTGITSALTGVESGSDGALRSRALWGDLLACVGAVAGAMYYLIGRRVRQRVSLWPYVALVYGAAFVSCVVLAFMTSAPLAPQPPREVVIFAALALGPMLLGHTGMNWALGYLPAYIVNLTTLGEPVGATLLAALLPGIAEVPGIGTVVGGTLVIGGVFLAARRR